MNTKTKRTRGLFPLLLALSLLLSLCGCGAAQPTGLWADASYTADTELGTGEKTLELEVSAEDAAVTFTIHTDAATLGEALLALELIAGDESEFGLYIKVVNGIRADYDEDGAYWALYQNGEYMMSGVDSTDISGGEHYELVYTKD